MAAPCVVWDVDPTELGVCSDWDTYTPEVQAASLKLASLWLWAATGRRFGPCPVTVRPSQGRGALPAYLAYPVWPGQDPVVAGPYLFGGRWFNLGQGCSSCCGSAGCAVVLRGPVAEITEVLVDGDVVPPSAYRVDVTAGAWLLVRTDGSCWPACQNMTRGTDEVGTFEVTYGLGEAPPDELLLAVAMLACEWGKDLTGSTGACSLPANMTRLSRQGVEVEIEAPSTAGDSTGIKMVDDVITALNPSGLKSPPRVLSLDLPEQCDRFTVIPAGS